MKMFAWWDFPNMYTRLGVDRSADTHAIQDGYAAKAMKYLDDKRIGYLNWYQAIDNALRVLSNPVLRADHDKALRHRDKYFLPRNRIHTDIDVIISMTVVMLVSACFPQVPCEFEAWQTNRQLCSKVRLPCWFCQDKYLRPTVVQPSCCSRATPWMMRAGT